MVGGQFHALDALPPGSIIPRYRLNKMLGCPQSRRGRFGEKTNLFPKSGIKRRFFGRPDHSLVTIPTELSRLLLERVNVCKLGP
jgi:hypothetical protein